MPGRCQRRYRAPSSDPRARRHRPRCGRGSARARSRGLCTRRRQLARGQGRASAGRSQARAFCGTERTVAIEVRRDTRRADLEQSAPVLELKWVVRNQPTLLALPLRC
eukprot:3471398-Prymnesium_polylepis.3